MHSSLTGSSVPQAALAAFCSHQVALPKFPEHFLFLHCDLGFLKKERRRKGKECKGREKGGGRGREEGTR